MNIIDDIWHNIVQHLPFVDRRELSLTCKARQEDLQSVFAQYMELAFVGEIKKELSSSIDEIYLSGTFMLYVIAELTLRCNRAWSSDHITVYRKGECSNDIHCGYMINITYRSLPHPMQHIDKYYETNMLKIVYYKGHLFVKNWEVILKRKGILIPPNIAKVYKNADPFEDGFYESMYRTMENFTHSIVSIWAERGYQFEPVIEEPIREFYSAYKQEILRKPMHPWLEIDDYDDILNKMTYSGATFLEGPSI